MNNKIQNRNFFIHSLSNPHNNNILENIKFKRRCHRKTMRVYYSKKNDSIKPFEQISEINENQMNTCINENSNTDLPQLYENLKNDIIKTIKDMIDDVLVENIKETVQNEIRCEVQDELRNENVQNFIDDEIQNTVTNVVRDEIQDEKLQNLIDGKIENSVSNIVLNEIQKEDPAESDIYLKMQLKINSFLKKK